MLKQTLISFLLVLALNTPLFATTPPRDGGAMPEAYLQNPETFTYKRALESLLENVLANRRQKQRSEALTILGNAAKAAAVPGPTIIWGRKSIPILLVRFSNTKADRSGRPLFATSTLQRKLFDGDPEHPGATIGSFYSEMSYDQFTVDGTVYDWKQVSRPDTFYEGKDFKGPKGLEHCNGMCRTARMGDLIKEALDLNPNIDWAQYDNDGPDGRANSGDDNGYVDFVAFAHAENGSECNRGTNIWSHKSTLSSWTNSAYVTKSRSAKGGFIRIDDYTIQPAYGCNGTTPNDIGVFAHEFGHAFGLPDLYDTSGRGEGVGNWCLMSGGSWGGDGKSPDQPVQMSPWAKELLGWITPKNITDNPPASIATYEDNPVVYRLRISPMQYYLINNIGRKLSNSKLPTAGVQIWLVNESAVNEGLKSNRVNSDPDNYGVELIEADGLRRLRTPKFRGGPGDLFPGSSDNRTFDSSTNPKNIALTAICEIVAPGDKALTKVLVNSNLCAGAATLRQPAPGPKASTTAAPASNFPRNQATTLVSEVLANPQRFLNREVRMNGRLENKGANLQLRQGRDFQLSDSSGSIPVSSIRLPLEVDKAGTESYKTTIANVLNENVRVVARVEFDPNTGRPRLIILSAVVVRQ